MLRIKKLDIFIIKSFFFLFVGTFTICLFIFMMQFLWRYVDELVGKGLEMTVLAQFFFYSALTLVPLSLPLAILLASLMTFGNFGERYELLSMRAAGISLIRVMRPLIVIIVIIAGISFYFQNVIAPNAQVQLYTLLYSMKQKSPELDIPEGVFYDEIKGYNIYVKGKDRKTGALIDVMIYDFSDGFENAHIIVADTGYLETTADKQHLYLHLYDGESFENIKQQAAGSNDNVPYRRETFREKHSIIEFDADFNMIDGSFLNDHSISKNMEELQMSIDSLEFRSDSIGRSYFTEVKTGFFKSELSAEDSVRIQRDSLITSINVDSLFNRATLQRKQGYFATATSRVDNAGSDWNFKSYSITENDKNIRRHQVEWHKKLTLSVACLIFFFIGAPLGAIIRKGGLGMPVIISVTIFIFYYIIDNTGFKMARDGNVIVWMGMWVSAGILFPLGAFFTYKSNNDSVVFNPDAYMEWAKRIIGIRSVRHIYKKEVIITDPDYTALPEKLRALGTEARIYLDKNKLKKAPNYYTLWTNTGNDEEIAELSERMEEMVEELSNSKSAMILNELNNYPVIPVHAHVRPFRKYWLNIVTGVLLPIGFFFYLRIWMFRIRLYKDLKQIIKTSENISLLIEKEF